MFTVKQISHDPSNPAISLKKFDDLEEAKGFVSNAIKSQTMIIYESNEDESDYHIFWFNPQGKLVNIQCGYRCIKLRTKSRVKVITPCKYQSFKV